MGRDPCPRELKVTWSEPDASSTFTTADLAATMASAPSTREQLGSEHRRFDGLERFPGPQQSFPRRITGRSKVMHRSRPCCVVADVRAAAATVWSSTQDTYGLRRLLAKTLGLAPETIRVVYLDGSGSYGSNGAWDAANDAVLLSRAAGKPVRLQWMRADEHGWDPKGPAQLLEMAGGLDAGGNLRAFECRTIGFAGPQSTDGMLASVSAGISPDSPRLGGPPTTQNLDIPYAIPNMRVDARALSLTPIRTSNLRAPNKIGNTFASEAFIDELAYAAKMDPMAFRRRGLTDPRALAVIDKTAAMIGWQTRPAHSARAATGSEARGQGFAYIRYKQMETYVAMAMQVAVNRTTGKVQVLRVACAHDCGLIINPDGLRNQVEGNITQTLSRTLHEEVTFEKGRVTSTDWVSYPILRFPEAPVIEVALLDHPLLTPWGAGEAACAPVAAALSNAIFDATGVRLRTAPFTLARVRQAMA